MLIWGIATEGNMFLGNIGAHTISFGSILSLKPGEELRDEVVLVWNIYKCYCIIYVIHMYIWYFLLYVRRYIMY